MDYAGLLPARMQVSYNEFWESGHLLWRSLVWQIARGVESFNPGWIIRRRLPSRAHRLDLTQVGFPALHLAFVSPVSLGRDP